MDRCGFGHSGESRGNGSLLRRGVPEGPELVLQSRVTAKLIESDVLVRTPAEACRAMKAAAEVTLLLQLCDVV